MNKSNFELTAAVTVLIVVSICGVQSKLKFEPLNIIRFVISVFTEEPSTYFYDIPTVFSIYISEFCGMTYACSV
jgi:hypothetical protein